MRCPSCRAQNRKASSFCSLCGTRLTGDWQIEAFFSHQEVIAARYSTAEAHVWVHEVLGGVSEELANLGQALEQAEQRTEYMQARASAIDRLVKAGILEMPGHSTSNAQPQRLGGERDSAVVEEQLVDIKRGLDLN